MKKAKRLFCIFLSILVFIIAIGNKYECKAAVNTFSTETITVGGHSMTAYVYSDPSLLPDTKQLYWVQNGKVQHALFNEALLVMVNKKFGLSMSPNYLTGFLSWIESNIWSAGEWLEYFFTGNAYAVWNGTAIVGVAIGDLTGYTLTDDLGNNDSVTIPSVQVNVLQEMTEYYITVENPISPDYINIPTINKTKALEEGVTDNAVITALDTSDLAFRYYYFNYGSGAYKRNFYSNSNQWYYSTCDVDNCLIVASGTSYFNNFVTAYNLSLTNNSVSLDTYMNNFYQNSFNCKLYDKSNNTLIRGTMKEVNSTSGSITTFGNAPEDITILHLTSLPFSNSRSFITVYKELSIPTQITNNVYNQQVYKSNTWNNYNPTINNDFRITVPQMQGASQGNTTIYNESKTTTNTNISNNNYQIDNSVNDNSVTTIINNYYPSDSGGGGTDDDDDVDDTIWKALLKAIGDFLKKIGELIATILTGLVSILTSVLDAIAAITTNFTGVTTFISSVFGFLPSDVLAVITLGITLGILISLIKMFGK